MIAQSKELPCLTISSIMAESPRGGGSTGYGPAGGRWQRLQFDGDERKYEQWELRFLGYMLQHDLKSTVLPAKEDELVEDAAKQERAFAEMIQFLDDKSLGLVMRDAEDNGRAALKLLREHYAGSSKPRIISMYTELTSLKKNPTDTVTDYIIKTEKIATALRQAGEVINDGLLIAMVLKGLPEEFASFVVVTTQNETQQTDFVEFKKALRSFEDTEQSRLGALNESAIMKARLGEQNGRPGGGDNKKYGGGSNNKHGKGKNISCFTCNQSGHISANCPNKPKKWCTFCRTPTHNLAECRSKNKQGGGGEKANKAKDEGGGGNSSKHSDEHSYSFFMVNDDNNDCETETNSEDDNRIDKSVIQETNETESDACKSLLVDSGSTSHIQTEESAFVDFDPKFEAREHTIELADGSKTVSVAEKRGTAIVNLRDSEGKVVKTKLDDVLYIPSYPQDIFSVRSATKKGAEVTFSKNGGAIVGSDGRKFDIKVSGGLYYVYHVNVSTKPEKQVQKRALDVDEWHKIMGHCNVGDLISLENVVDGMKIKSKKRFHCETCVLGKMSQSFNRTPDDRATAPLDMIHTDVSGPIEPVGKEGFKYALDVVDDYSGTVFVYFLKRKADAPKAFEKFLAESSPFGKVKNLRSDNGGEYISK